MDLKTSLTEYNDSLEKTKLEISGILGLPLGGSNVVNIPSRPGYVYVRLRDNLSEVIQAFNDSVSAVFGLPVIVQRSGRRWIIVGRDIERYENWGTPYPFLPVHGNTHSFDKLTGGGDVVFVYPDQFIPLLVYPSGTGAKDVLIAEYILQKANGSFQYVGNTGTVDLTVYKPTNTNAIMGVLYLDSSSGGYGFVVNSGTPFSASLTGSADIAPFIPTITGSSQIPLYAFRLVSGTSTIGWDNLYNVRQFFGGGSAGGTNALPALPPYGVVYVNYSGTYSATGTFQFDEVGRNLMLFSDAAFSNNGSMPIRPNAAFQSLRESGTYGGSFWGFGYNSNPGLFGIRANGDKNVPLGLIGGESLNELIGVGYGQSLLGIINFQPSGTQAVGDYYKAKIKLVATNAWTSGSWPTRVGIELTPSGTTNPIEIFNLTPDGLSISGSMNIPANQTYNISGSPHTHLPLIIDTVSIAGRTSDISVTNFVGGNIAGLYRISYILEDTTADLTAGVLTLTISWTDDAGATTQTTTQVLTTLGRSSGSVFIRLASGNITYAVTHSGIFASSVYSLYAIAERLK